MSSIYCSKLGIEWNTEDLKKVGHDLEDQIYSILRKSRVITNIRYRFSIFIYFHNLEIVFLYFKINKSKNGLLSL